MADATYHHAPSEARNLRGNVAAFFAAIGRGLVRMGENSSRYRRLQALSALSDEALAERGLRRENIARHVFADVYYV